MNYYETLYIIHSALEAGRLKDIIMGVEDSLKKIGGQPLAVELWGKRKLSYFIDKQKYGTYVLIQYNGEGKCTNDFAVELEHNPNILAYLTTVINSNEVLEIEEDLDTQIIGKTREAERSDSKAIEVEEPSGDETEKITTKNKIDEPSDDKSSKQVEAEKDAVVENTEKDANEAIESSDTEKVEKPADDIVAAEEKPNQSEEESNKDNADEEAAESIEE